MGSALQLIASVITPSTVAAVRAVGLVADQAAARRRRKITAQGFEAMPRLDPALFAAFLKADLAKRTPVLRATGASLDWSIRDLVESRGSRTGP